MPDYLCMSSKSERRAFHKAATLAKAERRALLPPHDHAKELERRRAKRLRLCQSGKKAFKTQEAAETYAPFQEQYRCKCCGSWHNATPRVQQQARA